MASGAAAGAPLSGRTSWIAGKGLGSGGRVAGGAVCGGFGGRVVGGAVCGGSGGRGNTVKVPGAANRAVLVTRVIVTAWAPWGTTAVCVSAHSRITAATSSVDAGLTTARGWPK